MQRHCSRPFRVQLTSNWSWKMFAADTGTTHIPLGTVKRTAAKATTTTTKNVTVTNKKDEQVLRSMRFLGTSLNSRESTSCPWDIQPSTESVSSLTQTRAASTASRRGFFSAPASRILSSTSNAFGPCSRRQHIHPGNGDRTLSRGWPMYVKRCRGTLFLRLQTEIFLLSS